jgi:D-alanyl-D-alanine carboxypeptidase
VFTLHNRSSRRVKTRGIRLASGKEFACLGKRITLGIVAVLLVFAGFMATPSVSQAKYASIVVDADTGRILHGTNIDTRNYPASLTKMMTLYMVFDALKSGKVTLDTKFTVSRRAARQPASKLGLRYRQTLTVQEAILALVTKSANDVATMIGENMAGSERTFALRMTAKARQLGMSRTTFRNASGLPHRGQLSTARDMAKLARSLITEHPHFYGYFSVKNFKYKGRVHKNHNKLLTSYEGTDGIKTGYIRASGYNLVASAKRQSDRLIGVVFGGNSSKHRNRHMTNLLNQGFRTINGGQAPASKVMASLPAPKPQTKAKPGAATRTTWAVQVGAFARYAQAYDAARTAVDTAPTLLREGEIKVVPLKKRNGKTLHRARINGISKKQAYRACRTLKKKRQHCMEMTIKTPLEIAANFN